MEKIDVVAVARMEEGEREKTMQTLFQQLLDMSDSDKISTLTVLITDMAQKATDEEYLKLCITNLKLASGLDDEALKGFLKLRMQVSSSLPQELSERDGKMIQEALSKIDTPTREKISKNM